jgi:hypothetical protein
MCREPKYGDSPSGTGCSRDIMLGQLLGTAQRSMKTCSWPQPNAELNSQGTYFKSEQQILFKTIITGRQTKEFASVAHQ